MNPLDNIIANVKKLRETDPTPNDVYVVCFNMQCAVQWIRSVDGDTQQTLRDLEIQLTPCSAEDGPAKFRGRTLVGVIHDYSVWRIRDYGERSLRNCLFTKSLALKVDVNSLFYRITT
jgi:hypothetical protein